MLMKSMTLSISLRCRSSGPPHAGGLERAAFGLQFVEVRADVLLCGGHQCRRETIIDGFCDRLHGGAARAQRGLDLPLPVQGMREVAGDDLVRIAAWRCG